MVYKKYPREEILVSHMIEEKISIFHYTMYASIFIFGHCYWFRNNGSLDYKDKSRFFYMTESRATRHSAVSALKAGAQV